MHIREKSEPASDEEGRYQRIFEDAPVALWDLDLQEVCAFLDGLRQRGITDLSEYFRLRSEELAAALRMIVVRDVNRYAVRLFEAPNKDALRRHLDGIFPPESRAIFLEQIAALWAERPDFEGAAVLRAFGGRKLHAIFRMTWLGERCQHVLVSILDVSRHPRDDEATQRLAAIVQSSEDAILSKDLHGIIESWNAAAERIFGWTAAEAVGQPITILIPPDRLDEEPKILARIRRGERVEHYETVRRRKDGSLLDVSLTVSPVRDARGEIIGASKISRDITERKKAEQQRELLMAELSHRVKNTLATVMSIERLSFDRRQDAAAASRAFRARIQALAYAHGRLAESNWLSVSLQHLIEDELAPYRDVEMDNVVLSGPSVRLSARSAISLGLAIHELATNAAKYGALSSPPGEVSVRWQIKDGEGMLELEWIESGGPPVKTPSRRGFGRLLLEEALKQEICCTVTMDFRPEGLRCTLLIPGQEFKTRLN